MASGVPLSTLAGGVDWQTLPGGQLGLGALRPVYIYQRGTTTQVPVFSDQALTQSLSQPLQTSPEGQVPGYIAAETAIDFYDVFSQQRIQSEPIAVGDLIGSDGKIGGAGSLGLSSAGISVGLPSSVVSASPSGGPTPWTGPGLPIAQNEIVSDSGTIYICDIAHTTGASFDPSKFTALGSGGSGGHYQTVEVGGTAETQRSKLNLIAGTNVTITPADNSGADSTDITLSASGTTGATGPPGPSGATATWRGVWSSATTYNAGDGVSRNGVPYISNVGSNVNNDPATDDGTHWLNLQFSPWQFVDSLSGSPRTVTDWGAIINTALTAGVRHFVFGDHEYLFSTPINCVDLYGVVFEGPRSHGWINMVSFVNSWAKGGRLVYTGGASPHITASDGAMTNGSKVLTSASGPFSLSPSLLMAGAPITVAGAGPGGATLTSKIVSIQSSNQVTLEDSASTTVSGAAIDFINWTSAINAIGSDGLQIRELGVFYNNAAFDGILIDVRYNLTWSAAPLFTNSQIGSVTYQDFAWNDFPNNKCYGLIHANGVGERFTAIDCDFCGALAAVRGMYQMNSDDFTFERCSFAGFTEGTIVNPGRYWHFRDCVFAGISSTFNGSVFLADTDPGNVDGIFTIDGCSFWDFDATTVPIFLQKPTHTWYFAITGRSFFWTNHAVTDLQLDGPGAVDIRGVAWTFNKDPGVYAFDPGSSTTALKTRIVFEDNEGGTNLVNGANLAGHQRLRVRNNSDDTHAVVDVVGERAGRTGVAPSATIAGGQSNIVSGGVIGTDMAGIIEFTTSGGGGSTPGHAMDVTFGSPIPPVPLMSGWAASPGTPIVMLSPYDPTGISANNDKTWAAQAYAVPNSNTGWSLYTVAAVPAGNKVIWAYRVIQQ